MNNDIKNRNFEVNVKVLNNRFNLYPSPGPTLDDRIQPNQPRLVSFIPLGQLGITVLVLKNNELTIIWILYIYIITLKNRN